ncbi:MAG TPA: alkaline phosphatase family protein [Myxococcota bacterium]|nr:alkaline phosphatase family protein [Myxococcota bacterium]
MLRCAALMDRRETSRTRAPGKPARADVARRASLAFALALGLLVACTRESPVRREERFADLATFAAEHPRDDDRPRVVVIGVDGASWDYIDPLVAAGALPNFARLKEHGATARLRSVDTHFTPPAWTAMFTGKLPAKTGVYSFGSWDFASQTFHMVSSLDVAVPAVWDVASAAGLRVAAVGVPVTYPAHPVNGVVVGGLETPKQHGPRLAFHLAHSAFPPRKPDMESFAPPVFSMLEDAHNQLFLFFGDSQDDGVTRYDRVSMRVVAKGLEPLAQRTLGKYEFALGEFSPWVKLRVPRGGQLVDAFARFEFVDANRDFGFRVSPAFFRIEVPFTSPRELAGELEAQFGYYLPHEFLSMELVPTAAHDSVSAARWFLAREPWDLFLFVFGESDNAHHLDGFADSVRPVYQTIDAFLGELMNGLDARTTLIVVSDHGFGAYDWSVDLNRFLADQGLLRWKSPGVIDFDQSLVFHQMWQLYFQPKLLTPEELSRRGVEMRPGETPRQALVRHIADAAKAIRAPDGHAVPIELVALPDDAVKPAPDMTVRGHPDSALVEFWNVQHPTETTVTKLPEKERWDHARDGIAAFYGAQIRPGKLATFPIQDIAPTILDLLGLPVADDLDGQVVAGLLDGSSSRRMLARVAAYPPRAPMPEAAPGQGGEFEEALRALGYVGN